SAQRSTQVVEAINSPFAPQPPPNPNPRAPASPCHRREYDDGRHVEARRQALRKGAFRCSSTLASCYFPATYMTYSSDLPDDFARPYPVRSAHHSGGLSRRGSALSLGLAAGGVAGLVDALVSLLDGFRGDHMAFICYASTLASVVGGVLGVLVGGWLTLGTAALRRFPWLNRKHSQTLLEAVPLALFFLWIPAEWVG